MINILRRRLAYSLIARQKFTPRNEHISPRFDAIEDRTEAPPPGPDDMLSTPSSLLSLRNPLLEALPLLRIQ